MTTEIVLVRKFRRAVPDAHRASLDTRLRWLWHQRFGTVQMVWQSTDDILDKTAATLVLQAIMARDLDSISQLLHRIEGGAIGDRELLERVEQSIRI
jgi:hypothetical protein